MEITATGKNVEIAIQNGLLECGLTREEVQVKVIEEGGLLKKAKVVLSWGEQPSADSQQQSEQQEEVVEEQSTPSTENDISEDAEADIEEPTPVKKAKKVRNINTSRLQEKCTDFLTNLIAFIDKDAKINCTTAKNEISYTIESENKNISKLIGFHGDTLKSLNMLLSAFKTIQETPVRIYLDINGYKAERQQSLIDLANKTAEQAVNIERNIHLDPMSAFDRRIIHTTLQDRDDVTTESTGEGEKRHVVVKPVFRR